MPEEPHYAVVVKDRHAGANKLEAQARAQIRRWANVPQNISWLNRCDICGKIRIESRMTYFVAQDMFICGYVCKRKIRIDLRWGRRIR